MNGKRFIKSNGDFAHGFDASVISTLDTCNGVEHVCFFTIKSIGNIVTLENLTKIVYTFVSLYTNKKR